jgi:predicted RNA-binding protein with PUA-like domain
MWLQMRKKFKIYHSKNNNDPLKAGKRFKPAKNEMVVMNSGGVFFVYNSECYYPSITKLSDKIGDYDVVWSSKD